MVKRQIEIGGEIIFQPDRTGDTEVSLLEFGVGVEI